MIAKGPPVLRFFYYGQSKKNMLKILEKFNPEQLKRLKTQVESLKKCCEQSSIAFIGASLVILQNEQKDPIVKLIDPAHIVVRDADRNRILGSYRESDQIFSTPDNKKFEFQKESNIASLNVMLQLIQEALSVDLR